MVTKTRNHSALRSPSEEHHIHNNDYNYLQPLHLFYAKRPRKAWRYIFLTSAGFYALGTVIYWVYGTGRRQWWSFVYPPSNVELLPQTQHSSPPLSLPPLVQRPYSASPAGEQFEQAGASGGLPDRMTSAKPHDMSDPYNIRTAPTSTSPGCFSPIFYDDPPSRRQSL
jgi:hypothetical protein